MARWKMVTHLAVAMREKERLAAEKRVMEEQRQESIKNGTIFRSLKRSRNYAGQRAKASLVSHERWFKTLETETEERRRDVAMAGCQHYQREDERNQREVLANIRTMDSSQAHLRHMETAIEMIRMKEKETEGEISATRHKLRQQRLHQSQMRVPRAEKVESRVQLAEERLGLQLAENRRLTELIGHLEGQRDQVTALHAQLRVHLDDLSKQLGGHVEEAQSTYEQRDMNKRNIQKLREHMAKSVTAQANDMQNLQFKIDVLRRMEDFMMAKNRFRPDEGRERRKASRRGVSNARREMLALGDLLKKIQKDLNEQGVDKIVNTFVELQTENFMLFTNISHVREGCHRLKGQVEAKRNELRELRINKIREKMDSLDRKEELNQKIDACRNEAERKEAEGREADEMINTYTETLKGMLGQMNYTAQDISNLAGVLRKIEERNIHTFLAEIEHYVNHLHCLQSTLEYIRWRRARRLSLSMTGGLPEPLPPRQPPVPRVVVVPPQTDGWSVGDHDEPTYSDNDMALRPLELWEIRAQVEEELGQVPPADESFME